MEWGSGSHGGWGVWGCWKAPLCEVAGGWDGRQGAAPRWPSACPARGRQVGQGHSVGPPRPPRTPDKRPFFGRAGRRSRLFAQPGKGAAPPTPPAPRGAAAGSGGGGAVLRVHGRRECERRDVRARGGTCAGGNCVRATGCRSERRAQECCVCSACGLRADGQACAGLPHVQRWPRPGLRARRVGAWVTRGGARCGSAAWDA